MGRRPQAGRDLKMIQGQRRDEFFRKMRRRGGTPRMPTQGMTTTVEEELDPVAVAEEAEETPVTGEDQSGPADDVVAGEGEARGV